MENLNIATTKTWTGLSRNVLSSYTNYFFINDTRARLKRLTVLCLPGVLGNYTSVRIDYRENSPSDATLYTGWLHKDNKSSYINTSISMAYWVIDFNAEYIIPANSCILMKVYTGNSSDSTDVGWSGVAEFQFNLETVALC